MSRRQKASQDFLALRCRARAWWNRWKTGHGFQSDVGRKSCLFRCLLDTKQAWPCFLSFTKMDFSCGEESARRTYEEIPRRLASFLSSAIVSFCQALERRAEDTRLLRVCPKDNRRGMTQNMAVYIYFCDFSFWMNYIRRYVILSARPLLLSLRLPCIRGTRTLYLTAFYSSSFIGEIFSWSPLQ